MVSRIAEIRDEVMRRHVRTPDAGADGEDAAIASAILDFYETAKGIEEPWHRTKSRSDTRRYHAMRYALREIARKGCERLVDPHTCRKPNGYPRDEWCDGCIAAEGLGLPVEWFVIKR